MTVLDVVNAMAERLTQAGVSFGHGTTNAFDEAVWLTLWKLGLPLDELDAVAASPVTPGRQADVEAVVAQRIATRKPAAYLTREAWLQGVPFYVDERVIVPRSFIAELLADPELGEALDAWLSVDTDRVLDLCTGNGSLAVLAAMAYPQVQVDGADLSTDALEVARINVRRHGLTERITLIESDGLAALHGPYDLILCNPPYVNAASMQQLPAEYRAEPELALAGGRTAWTSCAGCCRTRRRACSRRACWCWRSATSAPTSRRRFRRWRWSGWRRALARIRCCWSRGRRCWGR